MSSESCSADFYLVLHQKGWSGLSGRLTSTQPSLNSNERVLKLSVVVPKAMFKTPSLEAKITVPEGAVMQPTIAANVVDNVKEIIEQQTGMVVTMHVVQPTTVTEEKQ